MELGTFLAGDAALLVFSGVGLVATGLAIMRDIPVQQRTAERPVRAGDSPSGPTSARGAG